LLCQEALHLSETRETNLQAEDHEYWGDGPRCSQDCGYQATKRTWRNKGICPKGRQGKESSYCDGPDGTAHRSIKKILIINIWAFNNRDKTLYIPDVKQWLCGGAYHGITARITNLKQEINFYSWNYAEI